jgi:hypothetical protein
MPLSPRGGPHGGGCGVARAGGEALLGRCLVRRARRTSSPAPFPTEVWRARFEAWLVMDGAGGGVLLVLQGSGWSRWTPTLRGRAVLVSNGCCSTLVVVVAGSQRSGGVGLCICAGGGMTGGLVVAVLPSSCSPVWIQLGSS